MNSHCVNSVIGMSWQSMSHVDMGCSRIIFNVLCSTYMHITRSQTACMQEQQPHTTSYIQHLHASYIQLKHVVKRMHPVYKDILSCQHSQDSFDMHSFSMELFNVCTWSRLVVSRFRMHRIYWKPWGGHTKLSEGVRRVRVLLSLSFNWFSS